MRISGWVFARFVQVISRRHWRPFAARGWGSLAFSQIGGMLWLVGTLAQVRVSTHDGFAAAPL